MASHDAGDLFVQGDNAIADVHDKEDQIGRGHGLANLARHVGAELVGVDNPIAARVHQLDIAFSDGGNRADPVARNACGRLYNTNLFAREGIE